jgi:TonB family protein
MQIGGIVIFKENSSTRFFFRAMLLFLFILCVPPLNARADSDKDIQIQLESKLKKSTLAIRHFYSGDNLKYDSEGALVKGGKPGPWTLNAYFEPEKISLKKNSIILSGKRTWWAYNDLKKAPMLFRTSIYTKIEISRSPELNDFSGIWALLLKVFLNGDESFADFVPSHWKKIIQANFDSERVKREFIPANLKSSSSGFTDPVAFDLPRPGFTEEARSTGFEGWCALIVTIDEAGAAKVTEILKPLGMGLDDSAVKTIEESWKFTPAMRDGVPFELAGVRIEVLFNLL